MRGSWRWRRRGRRTFWHLERHRLVAAVLERGADEPLLVACAAVEARRHPFRFAPGLFELAEGVGGLDTWHVCALGAEFCRVACGERGSDASNGSIAWSRVAGLDEAWIEADAAAVEAAGALFERAGLALEGLDAEPCARLSLDWFLGTETCGLAAPDPLAAVSVAPGCESTAAELAELLAVPIGLAVARLAQADLHAHG